MTEFMLDRDGRMVPVGKEPKMRVKVLRSFALTSDTIAQVGDIVDIPAPTARVWAQSGRVALVEEGLPQITMPGVIENAEPTVTHREPTPSDPPVPESIE